MVKQKKRLEFRYYGLSGEDKLMALFGESWRREYGREEASLHFHNLMELGFCREGEGEMVFDSSIFSYHAGMFTVIPQNYPHTTVSREGSMSCWEYLFFDPQQIAGEAFLGQQAMQKEISERLKRGAFLLEETENRQLAQLFHALIEEAGNPGVYTKEIREALLTALVLLLTRIEGKEAGELKGYTSGANQIRGALEYLDSHYGEQVFVKELAIASNMSETHFRRVFRQSMGRTPMEYMNLIRIQNACRLLVKTEYSMEEVARRCGFGSISAFNRNFQKVTGLSPYRWKKDPDNYLGKLLSYQITAKKGW